MLLKVVGLFIATSLAHGIKRAISFVLITQSGSQSVYDETKWYRQHTELRGFHVMLAPIFELTPAICEDRTL